MEIKHEMNLGTIPGRTSIKVGLSVEPNGTMTHRIEFYKCIDCSFYTEGLNKMLEHKQRAGLWHRFKSRFKMALGK